MILGEKDLILILLSSELIIVINLLIVSVWVLTLFFGLVYFEIDNNLISFRLTSFGIKFLGNISSLWFDCIDLLISFLFDDAII